MLSNVLSILILVALIVLFAWLTRRAWRSRHRVVKWGGTVLAGLLTLIPTVVLAVALVGFYKFGVRHMNPVADIHVAGTSEQVARGERLAHACISCHSPVRGQDQVPILSGVNFLASFPVPGVGTVYAPNLTPSGNIKDWSDGEVIRAIREGVHRDGRSLIIMPSDVFRNLSDEDVQALVAYLRSQPPTGGPTPDNQLNLLGALFINLPGLQTAQMPVGHLTAPPPGTPEYGRYMVDVIGCRTCHGEQLRGGVPGGIGPPPGPNLTQIVTQWTEAQFMTFFNTGRLPDGGTVPATASGSLTAPHMPWPEVRAIATDDELKTIYAYLHSLTPAPDAGK